MLPVVRARGAAAGAAHPVGRCSQGGPEGKVAARRAAAVYRSLLGRSDR